MTLNNVHKITGTIAALLAIIGGINTYLGLPFPQLLVFDKHTVSHISANPNFAIEAIKTRNKVTVSSGDSFSHRFGIPISARGVTSLADNEKVWVVVVDQAGNFYLQHPPVTIRSGEWFAMNIRALEKIKRITFVRVNAEGNQIFLRKVEHDEWGKFTSLPQDATELAFIQLE